MGNKESIELPCPPPVRQPCPPSRSDQIARILDDNIVIHDDNDGGQDFVYMGQENDDVPRNLTRVIVHTFVRVIRGMAFFNRTSLTTVVLGERLFIIGVEAFCGCTSLHKISIPPAVRNIKMRAF